jgi:hypothetical protein
VCHAQLSGDVHHSFCHTCDIHCDILCDLPEPHGGRWALCLEILSTASRALCWGIHSKAWHTPVVDLWSTTYSDLWAAHQRKCKEWQKGGFFSHRWVMKSLLVGTGRYLCKVYNNLDSRACGYKRSRILPRIEGMVWEWNSFVVLCDPLCPLWPFMHLCGSYFVIYFNSI